jgi:hypothetical protein
MIKHRHRGDCDRFLGPNTSPLDSLCWVTNSPDNLGSWRNISTGVRRASAYRLPSRSRNRLATAGLAEPRRLSQRGRQEAMHEAASAQRKQKSVWYSDDMLGEGARTDADARNGISESLLVNLFQRLQLASGSGFAHWPARRCA